MEQRLQPDAAEEQHYVVEINKELSAQVRMNGQRLWLLTEIGRWPDDGQASETGQINKVLQAVLANAADYEDSVTVDEEGGVVLQRSLSVSELTEDELLDAFYRHGAFASYLSPLLAKEESITWQHHGFIRP